MISREKMLHRLGLVAVQFNISLKLHPNANSSMSCSVLQLGSFHGMNAYIMTWKKLFSKYEWFRKLHRIRLYWSNESRVVPIVKPAVMKYAQKLAEAYIRYQVKDKETAKKLTPDYIMGCKRILVSNQYFPTFNRKMWN